MYYVDQFEPSYPGIDLTFDGVGDTLTARSETLYPYFIEDAMKALSTKGLSIRVLAVDIAMRKMARQG